MEPQLVRPGEGEAVTRTGTRSLDIVGALPELCATLIRHAPGEPGPELHVHREHTDAFYVLEGTLVAPLGPDGAEHVVSVGSLVLAPSNVVHTFRNGGSDDLLVLNLHAPDGGFAEMLRGARDGISVPWDSFAPPADGGRSVDDAVVSPPGEGEMLDGGGGNHLLFKAQAAGGDGTLSLSETTIAPAFPGPPLHVHRGFTDCFYVLEGTLGLRLSEETVEAGPGTFATVPPGNAHTFFNPGVDPVRVVNLMVPCGFEAYIKELSALGSPPTPEVALEIGSRYDIEVV
jgi:mannose-6-phosphate isomerase-like protein (cupin superfamily)